MGFKTAMDIVSFFINITDHIGKLEIYAKI